MQSHLLDRSLDGRSMKISVQSIIAHILTVGDTALIILLHLQPYIRSTGFCRHGVEDDVDLRRVCESQFNYSM